MIPDWHTQAEFDRRIEARSASSTIPQPFSVWYHVACMGNWWDVFTEQRQLFASVGLAPTACVLGPPADVEYVRSLMPVAYSSPDLQEFETPTLQKLWEWCSEHQKGAVLYIHTKGVSAPHDANKVAWRRLMARYVIEPWKTNLALLAEFDILGIDWQQSPTYPHFAGNFWMARADWIAHLPAPVDYRRQGGPWIAEQPWERMHAEMWLGSRPYHHVKNFCCHDENLWCGDRVFQLLNDL